MSVADRHLLFGLLALQNEFIDKQQLVAAFGLWVADHSLLIDEILVNQGALSTEIPDLLARLVEQHINKRQGDVEASLRSLSGEIGTVRIDLEKLADSTLQQSMAKLPEEDPFATVGQFTSQGGRFRIRRPLDRGGLGIVSVALDNDDEDLMAMEEAPYDSEKLLQEMLAKHT